MFKVQPLGPLRPQRSLIYSYDKMVHRGTHPYLGTHNFTSLAAHIGIKFGTPAINILKERNTICAFSIRRNTADSVRHQVICSAFELKEQGQVSAHGWLHLSRRGLDPLGSPSAWPPTEAEAACIQGGEEWAATAPGEAAVTAPSTTELLSCQVLLNTIIPYVTAGGVQESWGECFQ